MEPDKLNLEFVGTIEEEDGTLSVIARDNHDGKAYKFTNCYPISCKSDFEIPQINESKETSFTCVNSVQKLESSQIESMLESWRKYLNEPHVEL